MKVLVQKLLQCRVRPYYLYQCDLIQGSSHLRTSVGKGLEIIENLRGHTSGYAVPQYVIDGPGGGGKIPINPGLRALPRQRKNRDPELRRRRFSNIRKPAATRRCNSRPSANITTNISTL